MATCVKEVCFFSFEGGLIKAKKGSGWPANTMQSVLCQAFVGNTLYTGFFDGSIATWAGTAIKSTMKAHTDGCHALFARANNQGLISGGGDGLVTIWTVGGAAGLQQAR